MFVFEKTQPLSKDEIILQNMIETISDLYIERGVFILTKDEIFNHVKSEIGITKNKFDKVFPKIYKERGVLKRRGKSDFEIIFDHNKISNTIKIVKDIEKELENNR